MCVCAIAFRDVLSLPKATQGVDFILSEAYAPGETNLNKSLHIMGLNTKGGGKMSSHTEA